MTGAIVYVASQHLITDAERCMEYCRARGYDLVGIVRDDWSEAVRLIQAGMAGVLVAADARHLDPRRRPRIEIVAEQPTIPGEHRTRVIRGPRSAGEQP